MLRYVYADRLCALPELQNTMFRDREKQFKQRLNWPVSVDENGHEKDNYDTLNPLYVIWEKADGTHGGSMRFLPTIGRTMVNEHFSHVTSGVHIASPLIWECTRFCLAPRAERRVAAGLVLGAGTLMEHFALEHLVGVFDPRMERIYSRLGATPDVIGSYKVGGDRISVGLWEFDEAIRPRILERTGVTQQQVDTWWNASFTAMPLSVRTAA